MNDLMLHFSGGDLSRLRALVAAVDKEIEHSRGTPAPAEAPPPKTALELTWSRLVDMLDLGAEPEMRTCPKCKALCMLGATRCSQCWASLPALSAKAKQAA
jgi:hypothetical protein